MIAAIQGDKVCACKALLYKTAKISARFAETLPPGPVFQGIEAGVIVAIQYAWRTPAGEPVYYIGRKRGEWIGCAPESHLTDLVL